MSNMIVNTNVLALNSHRAMKNVGTMQSKASSRLSSGLKINSAADDAAGLAISEKMRAQIRGLDMASKNAQDGISMVQTAEGGMQEIDNMCQRIRELTVQAANDTNDFATGDREKIQGEISQLCAEIDSMATRVEFNNKKLISGEYAEIKSATAYNEVKIQVTYRSVVSTSTDGVVTFATKTATISTQVAKTQTVTNDTKIFLQVGANANQKIEFNIGKMTTTALGINAAFTQAGVTTAAGSAAGLNKMQSILKDTGINGGGYGVNLSMGAEISKKVSIINAAVNTVANERAKLGAVQNRLEYTIKSLDVSSENLSASESRIRDTDMAKEMMNLTKANVLSQAANSMLAQANQAPQNVLQLLN